MTGIIASIDRGALMAVGGPGGPVFRSFATLGARIDATAKRKLSNDMVNVRTGTLRSSQAPPVVTSAGGRLLLTVTNTARYAAAVHNGTRPHSIDSAPGGKVLTGWVFNGAPVFTRHVNHPGTRARPWLRDSVAENIHRII